MLVDTHCHIHEPDLYKTYDDPADVLVRAYNAGVQQVLCVGTSQESSHQAVACAHKYAKRTHTRAEAFAVIGVHPHESKDGYDEIASLASSARVVGIGEIGLDYFYTHSPREVQIAALEAQIQVAVDNNLPISFHVREAFDDFWQIVNNFHGIRGVLHSFTDSSKNLRKGLEKGLLVGLNGISTFTKDETQQALFDSIPLDKILFETDAPFLTPAPFRGKINEPAYVKVVAEYHAARRGISLQEISHATTHNARALFALP